MTLGDRIGILGGTFNPVHIGHLLMAENAAQQLDLSSVVFVPAGIPPHKQDEDLAPTDDRVTMVNLAIADRSRFHMSRLDIDDVVVAYTWMLVERFRHMHPDADLWFILGGDSLRDLPGWEQPETILRECRLAVISRPGVDLPEATSPEMRDVMKRADQIEAPLCDISSTDIRHRIKDGRSIRYLVPESVRIFIEDRALYVHTHVPGTIGTGALED